jgi:hypothetical protein
MPVSLAPRRLRLRVFRGHDLARLIPRSPDCSIARLLDPLTARSPEIAGAPPIFRSKRK